MNKAARFKVHNASSTFHLNGLEVQPANNCIASADQITRIEPLLMSLLLALRSRHGQVASRECLLNEVWGDDKGSDEALTQAVSRLRRVLGDNPGKPTIIETLPKTGYRLIEDQTDLNTTKAKVLQIKQIHLLWSAIALLLGLMLYSHFTTPAVEQFELHIELDE